ncbi:hypothetical protein B0H13DRAFT_875036 [Mycena leptocephala]|nr:hypothetical protein B0H13DRAFT_875036 [Mycena leptocephala]
MPSTSVTLILCFFTFICGQLFNAFCTSLHPIKIEYIASVPVDTGFSFKTVIAIVISAPVVHDAAILVIRHLLATKAPRVLKTLPAAAADRIPIPQPPLLLILAVDTPPVARRSFRLRPVIIPIPRPFWIWRFLYRPPTMTFSSRVVRPLIEYPAALALVTKRVSSPLPCALMTGGRPKIQGHLPLFIHPFGSLVAAAPRYPFSGVGLQGVWGTNVKKEPEEDSEDTTLHLESNLSLKEKEIKASADEGIKATLEEIIEESPAEEGPGRPSHVPSLSHLAAAALSRKLQVQANDESCCASIEEVIEDEEVVEESVEEFQIEKVDDGMETHFVDAVSEGFSQEEKILGIVPSEHEPIVPLYEELDGLPSYEEFVQDAPAEPLFDTNVSALTHAVRRPPPLSLFASRVDVKSTSIHPRVSHLHLLARLSSRMSAPIVESA